MTQSQLADSDLPSSYAATDAAPAASVDLAALVLALRQRWQLLISGSLLVGIAALGVTYLIPPTFTARTMFLPPQQQQSASATALASLSALSGLAGGLGGTSKNSGEQYVSLLSSVTAQDRIIDQLDLMRVYDVKYRMQARKELSKSIRASLGKKDGLITLEADAPTPEMAAKLANLHVVELQRLTNSLALTEAQQRRMFFESELKRTHEKLIAAQAALQASGFNPDAIKAEPKSAAEAYGRVKAELSNADVKLQALRRALTDSAPEVQRQSAVVAALRSQLGQLEAATATQDKDSGYIGRYREYKYQESLFEVYARQFEVARLDESREGTLIQVVDPAVPPELKSKPKRGMIAVGATLATFFVLALGVLFRRRAEFFSHR